VGVFRRNAYQALAVHYGWALRQILGERGVVETRFGVPPPRRVLILEEDLHVAPDFFQYFKATAPLLDQDEMKKNGNDVSSLFAVSAFNDNGYEDRVKDAARIVRSDFFPGLGWMMTRKLWLDELQDKWPDGYWDDWLRDPNQRRGRHVLRPEISRTYHFGVKGGASGNQFGGRLSKILLNLHPVDWEAQDLSYLELTKYDQNYWNGINSAVPATSLGDALDKVRNGDTRLEYDKKEFPDLAMRLNLMDDEKAGIFRTAYRGVVETRPYGEHMLLLIPPISELEQNMKKSIA